MKHLARAPLVVLLFSLSCVAFAADVPGRPPGVAAENWVPISERLGLVIVQGDSPVVDRGSPANQTNPAVPRSDTALFLKPPVGGYFMVKGAAGWTRLVVIEPIKGPADVG